jgi:N-acetylglucosaminyldiphosphoundecaprenol N-acetyl-beta-D-mannosaminyltransferase
VITFEVLGVNITCIDKNGIITQILDWCMGTTRRTITYVNAHCINLAVVDNEYRSILNHADLVYSDGVGVVWASRFLGGPRMHKVTGRNWINDFCKKAAAQDLSLYILAGKPGVAQKASDHLIAQWPGLEVVGVCDGYFIEKDENRVLEEIALKKPKVVFVGMGVPLQEKWISYRRNNFDSPICWAVGALFDYVAGVEPSVPKLMEKMALEWLWRLTIDPRGKWRRYLLGNPLFMMRVLQEKFH